MANYGQMKEQLRLFTMGGLGLTVAGSDDVYGRLVNRAHADIVESFDWSFRLTNTIVNTVAPKNTGTITVTTGSPSILGTGTNFTYSDVGAFLWVGGAGTTPLPIADVQGIQLASLTSPYSGPSRINTNYVSAPLFYLVENALEVLSVTSQDTLLQKRLRDEINRIDPTRTDMGGTPSLFWCEAPHSPDGSLRIEFWPVPADARAYLVEYRQAAPQLIRDSDLPLVKSHVVEEKATATACQMLYASTGASAWSDLADKHFVVYAQLLEEALDADARRQQYRGRLTNPGPVLNGYDSQFTPSHAGLDDGY